MQTKRRYQLFEWSISVLNVMACYRLKQLEEETVSLKRERNELSLQLLQAREVPFTLLHYLFD